MAPSPADVAPRGGDHVYDALVAAGVELLVGLPGTQTLPLDRVVTERDEMTYIMARHETAIPHVAWGYYETTGRPAATLTVPGPGDTNAMHGLKNAYDDRVPVIHLSADINPEDRGKRPIHEIPADTYDTVVKANVTVETTASLIEDLNGAIERAVTPPRGPVRVGVPGRILEARFSADAVTVDGEQTSHADERMYADAVDALIAANRPLVYVGGGARRSANGRSVVRDLAQTLDAPVLASFKGKGVFPEDDPRFLGVSAKHLPASAERVLGAADVVLALGTVFDGVTTDHWTLPMGETLIHVTRDSSAIDAGYESDIAIPASVGRAGNRLLADLDEIGGATLSSEWDGAALAGEARTEFFDRLGDEGLLVDDPIHTPGALRTVREILPRNAIVTTDIGGFRLWAKQVFETYDTDQYVTSGSWAGMGVGLPAAIGATFAHPDRDVVALTGDGGLMMCLAELHTASEHGLDLTTIVLNNSDYGIISASPKIDQYTDGRRFEWESPDFWAIADGFGCHAVRVDTRSDLADALTAGLDEDRPTLIDVVIPTDEPSVAEVSDFDSTLQVE